MLIAASGWLQANLSAIPLETLWMFILALVLSLGGFYRVVYFVSLGYAFSISAMAITTVILFRASLDPLGILHCVALGMYGIRLGSFLTLRELKPSYQEALKDDAARGTGIPFPIQIAIWLGVSLLYVTMFSPGLFHFTTPVQARLFPQAANILIIVGLAIATFGLLIESIADRQKSAFKKDQPKRFCDIGLYKKIRCPNYFGEIVFWVGNWIAGIPFYTQPIRWLISIIGLVCIILIMMGSTKRLEEKQEERYGELEEFQHYTKTVPVLFPFLPIYTLKHIKVYLE